MSIDLLHNRIRKMKNPSVVDFSVQPENIPPHLITEEGNFLPAYARFCRELMAELKDVVPAVRFSFDAFALEGGEGLLQLSALLKEAKVLDYYTILDGPEILSPWAAKHAAETIFGTDTYPCDAIVISPYIGSDALKPFLPYCKNGKTIFAVVRSANKSAMEIQDLMTGSRLVLGATAEMVNRLGEGNYGKCGYSLVAAVVGAGAPESLRMLRGKHNRMYIMVDGLDYPNGNAKNCSFGFDQFGYGCVVSCGPSVTAAWKFAQTDGLDYLNQAKLAAERVKKNLGRYICVL